MSTVLVSGGAGFIGFALARELAEDEAREVIVVDNFVRGERDSALAALLSKDNVTLVELDLADAACIERLPRRPISTIFHMAALNGTQNFYERPYEVLRCSTLTTFNLLEAYGRPGLAERFIYAGSSESYASTVTRFGWQTPTAEDVPLCIDDPLNPRWSYGASKLHGEILVSQACREFDVGFSVIRYHNAYGPRMGDKHVVPDFLERAARGVYELHGYEETRSFMYIDDVVRATLAIADSAECAGEIINVGSDTEITIRELGEKMMEILGVRDRIELHPAPPGCVKRRSPDVSKLRRLTGFEPSVPLDDGLARTVAYYRKSAGS